MCKTKIVATVGPASRSETVIREMIEAGVNVFRLNFSHGSPEEHAENIRMIREISKEVLRPITLLLDVQGPKIRVGTLPEGGMVLVPGSTVRLVVGAPVEANDIPIGYETLAREVRPGMRVLMADGAMSLTVESARAGVVTCKVIDGGILTSRKGVNLPELDVKLPSLTEKDLADVSFGVKHGIDCISLSFVRSAEDVRLLKWALDKQKASIPVIAKIEKPQALKHLEEIVSEADGIMVARGDLGVELSPERVPMIQKQIIAMCNRMGKPVITATQMLESMINSPRPTRAEASDVANAILDGSDAVMLSGETAIGQYPVHAVRMMWRIADEVENATENRPVPVEGGDSDHAIAKAAAAMGKVVNPEWIVFIGNDLMSVRLLAAERPKATILAVTQDLKLAHAMNLSSGVRPVWVEKLPESGQELTWATRYLIEKSLGKSGTKVILAGTIGHGDGEGSPWLQVHTIA